MKLIIAGGRDFNDLKFMFDELEKLPWIAEVTLVAYGEAPGADTLGKEWADLNGIPTKAFPALWDDLTVPHCVVRTRADGTKYNLLAGFNRNQAMADYIGPEGSLAAFWDMKSTGTKDMIARANKQNSQVVVINTTMLPDYEL